MPLQARVDYDVYDWRIIRDEFRVSDLTVPATHRLALGNLKVGGNGGPDGRPLTGIFLEANGETSDPRSDHFVLVDTETGGLVYEKDTSGRLLVRVDKSLGLVTFNDSDNNAANGLTGQLRLPDGTTQSVEMSGRNLRALYMANDEWSVQALKSAAIYRVTYARPAPAQYYVGGTNGALGGGATRVYFPVPDTGRKVSIGEIFYRDSNNNIQIIESQDFVIGASPADPIGLPYIDIKEVAPDAVSFDFTYGYAVRNIRGASIVVRVLWNPQRFALSGDNAQNMRRLDEWGRGWRRTVTETYLQRGDAIR